MINWRKVNVIISAFLTLAWLSAACTPKTEVPEEMIVEDIHKQFLHNKHVDYGADVKGCSADYIVADIRVLDWSESNDGTAQARVQFVWHEVSGCKSVGGVGYRPTKRKGIIHYRREGSRWQMDSFQDLKVRLFMRKVPPAIEKLMEDRTREASKFLDAEMEKSVKKWPPRNEGQLGEP